MKSANIHVNRNMHQYYLIVTEVGTYTSPSGSDEDTGPVKSNYSSSTDNWLIVGSLCKSLGNDTVGMPTISLQRLL